VRNDSPVFHEYFKRSLKYFFEVLETEKIETVIHLGDLYDRRKYINFLTSKVCREEFLDRLNDKGIQTYIICGNHDVYYKDTLDVNSLRETIGNRYDFIWIYDQPISMTFDGTEIQLLPWICDANKEHAYETIRTTKAEILMGHLELNGFEMFRGIMSDHGLDRKTFDKFDMVMSGHYHHKSTVGNIHYLGAFAEYSWSDWNDPRGFHVFDTKTRALEFYRNPESIFSMFTWDDSKEQKELDYASYANKYVKVVCINRNDPYLFDTMLDKLYKAGPVDISIVEDMSSFTDNEEDSAVDESQDTSAILSNYIDGLTLPVNNDRMKEYMKEIYQEALSVEYVE
jgi:DNA repair exonuclease SbcCD nuclease subunit